MLKGLQGILRSSICAVGSKGVQRGRKGCIKRWLGGHRGPLRRKGLIEDGAWSCLKIQRGVERVFGFFKGYGGFMGAEGVHINI